MKHVCVLGMLLLAAGSLSGQSTVREVEHVDSADKYKVETNRFWNNWFISVGGGAQIYFGDHNKQMDFTDRLSPALDVAVGKWFTPGIGIRLAYTGLSYKGVTQNGSHSNGKIYDSSQNLYEQKFDMAHFHGDLLFNVSNLLFGYNEHRFYNLSPYAGLGWMVTWKTPRQREVSASIGLLNSFRLGSAFDLILDVRGSMVNDRFDGETGGRKEEGALSATLGLSYKLGKQGWGRCTNSGISSEEMERMRGKINNMMAENSDLRDALAREKEKEPKTIVEKEHEVKYVTPSLLVTFAIGKSTLTNVNRVNLGYLAKAIKDSNKTYNIAGYADKLTGSAELNERLSKERAQVVYDCLVNEFHVPASQLKVIYQGGVGNMFYDDPVLSRAVIMEAK